MKQEFMHETGFGEENFRGFAELRANLEAKQDAAGLYMLRLVLAVREIYIVVVVV